MKRPIVTLCAVLAGLLPSLCEATATNLPSPSTVPIMCNPTSAVIVAPTNWAAANNIAASVDHGGLSGTGSVTLSAGLLTVTFPAAGAGDLLSASNLSDLASWAVAQTNLHLVSGTHVQAYDAQLDEWAQIGTGSFYTATQTDSNFVSSATHGGLSGTGALSVAAGVLSVTFPAAGAGDLLSASNLSDLASIPTARTNLGLAIGFDVQAYDAQLDGWAQVETNDYLRDVVTAWNGYGVMYHEGSYVTNTVAGDPGEVLLGMGPFAPVFGQITTQHIAAATLADLAAADTVAGTNTFVTAADTNGWETGAHSAWLLSGIYTQAFGTNMSVNIGYKTAATLTVTNACSLDISDSQPLHPFNLTLMGTNTVTVDANLKLIGSWTQSGTNIFSFNPIGVGSWYYAVATP